MPTSWNIHTILASKWKLLLSMPHCIFSYMFRKKGNAFSWNSCCFRGTLTYFIWTGISPTYVAITTPHNDLVSWWGSQAVANILKADFVISGFHAPPMGECDLRSPSAEKYYWYGARKKPDSHHKQGKRRRWGHLYPQIVILLAWDYGLKVMFSTVLHLKNTWNSSSGVHNFLQT